MTPKQLFYQTCGLNELFALGEDLVEDTRQELGLLSNAVEEMQDALDQIDFATKSLRDWYKFRPQKSSQ
jgi:hypothetical protein